MGRAKLSFVLGGQTCFNQHRAAQGVFVPFLVRFRSIGCEQVGSVSVVASRDSVVPCVTGF